MLNSPVRAGLQNTLRQKCQFWFVLETRSHIFLAEIAFLMPREAAGASENPLDSARAQIRLGSEGRDGSESVDFGIGGGGVQERNPYRY